MDILIRICGSGLVLAIGLVFYSVYRYEAEMGEGLDWGEIIFYLILCSIGVSILTVGDRILDWETLPDLVRWGLITLSMVVGITSYIKLQQAPDHISDNEVFFF